MSSFDLLTHYVNGQCIKDVVFTPQSNVSMDFSIPITSVPPDRQGNGYGDEFVMVNSKRKTDDWTSYLPSFYGCEGVPKRKHPSFENPDIITISKNVNGEDTNNGSYDPIISGNGRFVAFSSWASDLIEGDSNDAQDIFVHDRQTGKTERVSIRSDGSESNRESYVSSISEDGRYVAFASLADNLVPDDKNGRADIFVYDRKEKAIERVSVSTTGEEANNDSHIPRINADGRYVAFNSSATNLVPFGTKGVDDVFVYDRHAKKILRASTSYVGGEANGGSGAPTISGDGRFVAFGSWANNLVPGDTNNVYDIFLRDMVEETIKRISIPFAGGEADGNSSYPHINFDGKFVAFHSKASNLVEGDSNDNWDVFVHNAEKGETNSCTVKSGNGDISSDPYINADGRFVVFSSYNSLTPDDTNGISDIFVHDAITGEIARVSRAQEGGKEITEGSFGPSISSDGNFIAFNSWNDEYPDVFVAKNPIFD